MKEKIYVADTTYDEYGIPRNSSFDTLFKNIKNRFSLVANNNSEMTLTLKADNGTFLSGLLVNGIVDSNGNSVISDASGVAKGFVSAGNVTLSVEGYIDLYPKSKTYTFAQGETYSETWTISTKNYIRLDYTANIKFSPRVSKISYSITAGGGGGGPGTHGKYSYSAYSGGGGCGGHSAIYKNVSVEPNKEYSAIVGTGGAGVSDSSSRYGKDGGNTSFMGNEVTGGSGGYMYNTTKTQTGNGIGGKPGYCLSEYKDDRYASTTQGSSGTEKAYPSSYLVEQVVGGGGGAGGAVISRHDNLNDSAVHISCSYGSTYGGDGANAYYLYGDSAATYTAASAGSNGGGGGGSSAYSDANVGKSPESALTSAKNGGSGFIAICIL